MSIALNDAQLEILKLFRHEHQYYNRRGRKGVKKRPVEMGPFQLYAGGLTGSFRSKLNNLDSASPPSGLRSMPGHFAVFRLRKFAV